MPSMALGDTFLTDTPGQAALRGSFPRSSQIRTRDGVLDGGLRTIRRRGPRHQTNIPQDSLPVLPVPCWTQATAQLAFRSVLAGWVEGDAPPRISITALDLAHRY